MSNMTPLGSLVIVIFKAMSNMTLLARLTFERSSRPNFYAMFKIYVTGIEQRRERHYTVRRKKNETTCSKVTQLVLAVRSV